jgi:predicted nucleotidyltransferase
MSAANRHTIAPAPPDALELLGVSPAGARILRYFVLRPQAEPHAREIQRVLGLGGRSLQRELARMAALGVLERRELGRRVQYRPVPTSQVWRAIRLLAGQVADPTPLLQAAFADVAGVEAAFLFGSAASGTARPDSDIDVLVVEGPRCDRKKMLSHVTEAAMLLGRDVNAIRYTAQSLAERLGDAGHPAWPFVRAVITGPKRWVAGSPDAIAPLVTAAGLDRDILTDAAA